MWRPSIEPSAADASGVVEHPHADPAKPHGEENKVDRSKWPMVRLPCRVAKQRQFHGEAMTTDGPYVMCHLFAFEGRLERFTCGTTGRRAFVGLPRTLEDEQEEAVPVFSVLKDIRWFFSLLREDLRAIEVLGCFPHRFAQH